MAGDGGVGIDGEATNNNESVRALAHKPPHARIFFPAAVAAAQSPADDGQQRAKALTLSATKPPPAPTLAAAEPLPIARSPSPARVLTAHIVPCVPSTRV